MNINIKKIYLAFLIIIIGLSMMIFGATNIMHASKESLTDAEIIEKAKSLGMTQSKVLLDDDKLNLTKEDE